MALSTNNEHPHVSCFPRVSVSIFLLATFCNKLTLTQSQGGLGYIVNEKYYSSDRDASSPYDFIDINGELSNVIAEPYQIEILARGFLFTEGPIWVTNISNSSDTTDTSDNSDSSDSSENRHSRSNSNNDETGSVDGYLLFTEYGGCIWKYWYTCETTNRDSYNGRQSSYGLSGSRNSNSHDDSHSDSHSERQCESHLECLTMDLASEGIAAIGWHENYASELWMVAFDSDSILKVDFHTLQILQRYDQAVHDGNEIPLYGVDDLVVDSNGNVYFTTFPFTFTDPDIIAGVFMIDRNSDSVLLVEQLNYGTNGIAMTKGERLIVAANSMDYPVGEFDVFDPTQVNYDNLFFRGYVHYSDGSLSDGFDYLHTKDDTITTYFDDAGVFDSSGFDWNDNYWQGVIVAPTFNGYAMIMNWMREQPIIGKIGFGPVNAGINFEVGNDNYMYITAGNFVNDTGILARIKLTDGNSKC